MIGHCLKTKFGQRYHSNNGHAPMGYAFSAAIGSWFGSNKKNNTINKKFVYFLKIKK